MKTIDPGTLVAEFIGTFALVFAGTGAVIVEHQSPGAMGNLGIAIVFGAVVMAMIYAFGPRSGAHLNPAVTLAFWVAGVFPRQQVLPYISSQFIAGIFASYVLGILFPDTTTFGETLPSGTWEQSFGLEIVITFTLMLVVLQVATGSPTQQQMAGIAIGMTVLLAAAFAGPICGASMNPARSLGPALIGKTWDYIWVYMTAPCIGALLAVPAWILLRKPSASN